MTPARYARTVSRCGAGRDTREVVLFAVVGFSPAILTETAWALAREKPAVVPDRVVAITTRPGREKIRQELLASSVWDELRRALKAGDRLEFGDTGTHIRVISRGTAELDDIRTPADNAAAADFILEALRQFVENPDVRVVATIAGGRKTMSALLYAAMSLIGRETDRVLHVLVNEQLEQRRAPKFYFPRNRKEAAGVHMADIPFVPLRNRFRDLGELPGRFSSLVARYTSVLKGDATRKVRVAVDPERNVITVDGFPVRVRQRARLVLEYLLDINRRGALPRRQKEAEASFKAFVEDKNPALARGGDLVGDLKRELSYLRKAFARAGVTWGPGLRRDSLRLPPFALQPGRSGG